MGEKHPQNKWLEYWIAFPVTACGSWTYWCPTSPSKGREVIHPVCLQGCRKSPAGFGSFNSVYIFHAYLCRRTSQNSTRYQRTIWPAWWMRANWIDDIPASFPSSLWLLNGAWCRWMEPASTHTSYLTSMVPTSPAHNTLGGRRTQTFVYSLASPDALAHESPFRRSSRARCESQRAPLCPGRLRMSRARLLFLALSELSDGAHRSLTLIAIFCNCRSHVCMSLKSKCARQVGEGKGNAASFLAWAAVGVSVSVGLWLWPGFRTHWLCIWD